MTRPKLAPDIFDIVPPTGRYEGDIFNDFLRYASRREIENALQWLCEKGHLRKCGDAVRPIYARPEKPRITYTNIRPIHGTDVLLQMHQNFTEEKPR